MQRSPERSIMSHLVEEFILISSEMPFLEFDKQSAALHFISHPSKESGLDLIKANVELSKNDRERQSICFAISRRIVGEAISNSALY